MDDLKDMDIIKNIRTVEWLKSELLTSVAYLYELLVKGEDDNKEELSDTIANIILMSLLMSKRVGLNYEDIANSIEKNIKLKIREGHKVERWYGDLSELLELLRIKLE